MSTLFKNCEKLSILIAKLHNSNSVIEYLLAASGSLLLHKLLILAFHFESDTEHSLLQTYSSEYK